MSRKSFRLVFGWSSDAWEGPVLKGLLVPRDASRGVFSLRWMSWVGSSFRGDGVRTEGDGVVSCRSGVRLDARDQRGTDIHHAGPFVIPAIYAGAGGEPRSLFPPILTFFLPPDERTGGGFEVRGDEVEGDELCPPPSSPR